MAGQTLSVPRSLGALFDFGVVGDLPDGQLLQRFTTGHREAAELAFDALVERHGPMVLRVCRRLLDDPNDAEDAFQATFLVLIRRAGSIRERGSLAAWLHGVALRVACRARVESARRRRIECRALRSEVVNDAGPERIDLESRNPRRARAAAREVPVADRALLPGGAHPRRGGRSARLAGRNGARPAGASPRSPAVAADPPRRHGLRGAVGRRIAERTRQGPPYRPRCAMPPSGSRPISHPAGRSPRRLPPRSRHGSRALHEPSSSIDSGRLRSCCSCWARSGQGWVWPCSALLNRRRPGEPHRPTRARRSVARCSGSRGRGPACRRWNRPSTAFPSRRGGTR